jgi:hypothetical protein
VFSREEAVVAEGENEIEEENGVVIELLVKMKLVCCVDERVRESMIVNVLRLSAGEK